MGKTAFKVGDVVKIKPHPFGVTQKVKKMAGRVGTVVGRKPSAMYVSYMVDIDGTVYQVKNASNLLGPLPKEALHGNYTIPKTKRSHKLLYNKDYNIIEIDRETDEFFISTTGITYKKSSIGKSLKFIPEEYIKYITRDEHGYYRMYVIARILFGKNKAFIPAKTFINYIIGAHCLTEDVYLKHCISGKPITCGDYVYKFNDRYIDNLVLDGKTVLDIDLKNMTLSSTYKQFPPGLSDKIPKVKEYAISFFNNTLGGDFVDGDMLRLDNYDSKSTVTENLQVYLAVGFKNHKTMRISYIMEDYPYCIASIHMLYDIMKGSTTIEKTQINNPSYVEEFRLKSRLTGGLRGLLNI